jgi:tripartite-type tricarboxylate transporter receptor subunit TctC
MKESGVDVEAAVWYGLLTPAGAPREVIQRLNAATIAAVRSSDMKQRLLDLGSEPVGSSPEAFAKQLRGEVAQWAEVVRVSGAKP